MEKSTTREPEANPDSQLLVPFFSGGFMDWKLLRFNLFQALDSLEVKEILMIEKENNVVTVCIVADGLSKIRPLVRMNIVDKLIEKNAADIYSQYLFCYEIWDVKEWEKQEVSKVLLRKDYQSF